MNEKFNENAKVEKFTNMLGIAVRLIVIDPLRHLNFDPYPSRTRGGPWVTLVATHATMRMSLIFKCPIISIVSELSGFWGVSTIKWNSYPTLL